MDLLFSITFFSCVMVFLVGNANSMYNNWDAHQLAYGNPHYYQLVQQRMLQQQMMLHQYNQAQQWAMWHAQNQHPMYSVGGYATQNPQGGLFMFIPYNQNQMGPQMGHVGQPNGMTQAITSWSQPQYHVPNTEGTSMPAATPPIANQNQYSSIPSETVFGSIPDEIHEKVDQFQDFVNLKNARQDSLIDDFFSKPEQQEMLNINQKYPQLQYTVTLPENQAEDDPTVDDFINFKTYIKRRMVLSEDELDRIYTPEEQVRLKNIAADYPDTVILYLRKDREDIAQQTISAPVAMSNQLELQTEQNILAPKLGELSGANKNPTAFPDSYTGADTSQGSTYTVNSPATLENQNKLNSNTVKDTLSKLSTEFNKLKPQLGGKKVIGETPYNAANMYGQNSNIRDPLINEDNFNEIGVPATREILVPENAANMNGYNTPSAQPQINQLQTSEQTNPGKMTRNSNSPMDASMATFQSLDGSIGGKLPSRPKPKRSVAGENPAIRG